mgnify:CR=1 FL=1|tara:strand:+ start:360 stop:479 length:120 start_codon:yes stop_codon:yes gene_type:complete
MREPKLQVRFWGIKLNAEGVLGILAAVLILLAALAVWRF